MVCTRSSWPDPVGGNVGSSPRKARHREEAADGAQRPTLAAQAAAAAPKLLLAAAVLVLATCAAWVPGRTVLLTSPASECTCPPGPPPSDAVQPAQQAQAEEACKARERATQQRCLQFHLNATHLLRSQLESCQLQLQRHLATAGPGQADSGVEQPGEEAAATAERQGTSAPGLEEAGQPPSMLPSALQTSSSPGGREAAQETQEQAAEDTASRLSDDLKGHVLNATAASSQLGGLSLTGILCGWAVGSTGLCFMLAWRLRLRQSHTAPPADFIQAAAAVKQTPARMAAPPGRSSSKARGWEGSGSIPAGFEAGQEGQQYYQPEEPHDSWSIQSSYARKVEAVDGVGAGAGAVSADGAADRAAWERPISALEEPSGTPAAPPAKQTPQQWRCNSAFAAAHTRRHAADGRFHRVASTGALLEVCPLFESDDGSPSAASSLSSASEDDSSSSAEAGSPPPSAPASSPAASATFGNTCAGAPWEVQAQEQGSVWLPEQSSLLDNPLYQPAVGEGGSAAGGPALSPRTAKLWLVDEGLAEGLRQLAEVDEALVVNLTAGQKQ